MIPGARQFPAARAGWISSLLSSELSIPLPEARQLIDVGAVYYQYERLPHDREIAEGEWLRVHAQPRRFAVRVADWRERIVAETEDFLIVDKPAGLPVHPTCDNGVENLIGYLQRALQVPLTLCHRLDTGTSGLVVLAKQPAFRSRFGRWLEKRRIEKIYRAWTSAPIELGLKTHYMAPDERGPRRLSPEALPGWKRCELEVQACTWRAELDAYELTIRLITGRMHQIRAQLSVLGAPILGDSTYGSSRPFSGEGDGAIALRCVSLKLPDGNSFRVRS